MRPIALFLVILLIVPVPAWAEEEDSPAEKKANGLWGPTPLGQLTPSESVVLNLEECIQRTITSNRELLVIDQEIQTAQEKEDEVHKIGYPVLEYEYNVGPAPKDVSRAVDSFFSGELTVFNKLKLGLGVPLQTFGKVNKGRELASLGIRAEKEKKEGKKTELALKVSQLYYGVLLAREVRRLIKTARDELAKQIEKRETRGGGDPTALLKMKLFRAELERRMEEIDKKEIMAKEALRILIDVGPSVRFEIASDRLRQVSKRVAPFEKYREAALHDRRDLKQLDILTEVRSQRAALEKLLPFPNLGVGAFFEMGRTPDVTGITTTDDFSDPLNFTRAGFGLRLAGQFDFHATASRIRQARSELFKTKIQRELARDGAILEVKEAYLNAKNIEQEIERTEEAEKLSRQLLFLTQSNYDIGLAEAKDLIEALQSFLEARGKFFEAVFNYNVAIATLDHKTGRTPQ